MIFVTEESGAVRIVAITEVAVLQTVLFNLQERRPREGERGVERGRGEKARRGDMRSVGKCEVLRVCAKVWEVTACS